MDLSYIKTVMSKAEIAYKDFGRYFLFLSCYSIFTYFVLSFVRAKIYSASFLEGDILNGILFNRIMEIAYKIVLLIPIIILMNAYKKRIKNRNQGLSLWLLEIMNYIIVFCGTVLPVLFIAVSASYESAEVFTILTTAMCILLCGIFADSRILKNMAYIYFVIPVIVLGVSGMAITYAEFTNRIIPESVVRIHAYLRTIFYVGYPCIGYLLISVYMMHKSKEKCDL